MKLYCNCCKKNTEHYIGKQEPASNILERIFEALYGGLGFSSAHKNMRCKQCGERYNDDLHDSNFWDSSDTD